MYTLGSKIVAHLNEADNVVNDVAQFPISCEIDTSNYCQNDCKWCIYKGYLKNNRVHLDFSLYKHIIRQLKAGGCKSITFTGGGEPTMNPNFLEMVDYAYDHQLKIGLITNGILLNKLYDKLSKFDFIRVSLDAVNAFQYKMIKNTDYFYTVVNNITKACKADLCDIGISMVYENGGKQLAEDFYKLGESLGCTYAQVKPVVDQYVEETSDQIAEAKGCFVTKRSLVNGSRLPCKLAGLIGQVGADGKYYYCCVHRGKEQFCVGDLNDYFIAILSLSRRDFEPDLNQCSTCRYMNYAEEYQKVSADKYKMLRHIDHL